MNASTALIVTAAGLSTRFPPNKLLHQLDGESIICKTIKSLRGKWEIITVIGYMAPELSDHLNRCSDLEITICHNSEYQKGLSSSIRLGMQTAGPERDYYAFVPGDKPFIKPETIERCWDLISDRKPLILVPRYKGINGHPTFFSNNYYDQFLRLNGDIGGREIIAQNPDAVHYLDLEDEGIIMDMDRFLKKEESNS